MRPALDPSIALHAIQDAHEAHRVDAAQVGETDLAHTFVTAQIRQHLGLIERHAHMAHALLVQPHVQTRGVFQQKT